MPLYLVLNQNDYHNIKTKSFTSENNNHVLSIEFQHWNRHSKRKKWPIFPNIRVDITIEY